MADVDSGDAAFVKPSGVGASAGYTLALAGFLPVMVIVALAPAVPQILARFPNVPYATTLIPLLVTIPGLVVALLSPVAGMVVDRFGRRRPLLVATLVYVFAGMAPAFLDDFIAILAMRLLVGLCEAFALVSINALMSDYFDLKGRRTWLTVQSAASPFLVALLVGCSGALTSMAWNGAFLSYALALPIFLAVLLFCPEPVRRAPGDRAASPRGDFPWKLALLICGVTLFSSTMFYVFIVQIGLAYAAIDVVSATHTGGYIAAGTIGILLGSLLFNLLSRRCVSEIVVAVCLAFMGAGMVGIGLSRDPLTMLGASLIQQVSAGMIFASLIYWMSQILPEEHRGRGFGLWSTASFAGQFLSPIIVGLSRGLFGGILAVFVALGTVTLVGALLVASMARKPRRPVHA